MQMGCFWWQEPARISGRKARLDLASLLPPVFRGTGASLRPGPTPPASRTCSSSWVQADLSPQLSLHQVRAALGWPVPEAPPLKEPSRRACQLHSSPRVSKYTKYIHKSKSNPVSLLFWLLHTNRPEILRHRCLLVFPYFHLSIECTTLCTNIFSFPTETNVPTLLK